MANPALERWEHAKQVFEQLRSAFTNRDKERQISYNDVEAVIQEIRIACEATIFLDIEYAEHEGVGQTLWDAHTMVNNRYRKMLDVYRKQEQTQESKRARRGVEKHYVDFIKTSQFFYKGYIQRLASHFKGKGLSGLRRIAHRLGLERLSANPRIEVTPEVENVIEASCHATLLRLGDLSRYRNQVRTRDRSWAVAMSYYGLANDLCPDNGSAQNQMAAIALVDGNNLDAIYHLFRAIAVKKPHPLAPANLKKQMKSVTAVETSRPQPDILSTLLHWFVRLQARFYEGMELSKCAELEKEVLSRVVMFLKDSSFAPDVLEKIVMISLAAEWIASQKLWEFLKSRDASANAVTDAEQDAERAVDSKRMYLTYNLCTIFNINMMHGLLQVLSPELDSGSIGEERPMENDEEQTERPQDKLSVIARRILPALRLYNTWLAIGRDCLKENPLRMPAEDMWNMYANICTKLVNLFNIPDLPAVEYLFEEDEAIVGFEPLHEIGLDPECDLLTDVSGKPKTRSTDHGVERYHPNVEMQARVREILVTAVSMVSKQQIPVVWAQDGSRHVFRVDHTANSDANSSPHTAAVASPPPEAPQPSASWNVSSNNSSYPQNYTHANYGFHNDDSLPASDSIDNDPHTRHMVDALLEPSDSSNDLTRTATNETSYGMHTATANELLGSRTSLFGFQDSVFAPQAHELQATSPTRSLFHNSSPLSLSTREGQLAAAAHLDQITGYPRSNSGSGSWGRNAASGTVQAPVNQLLQESLAMQYPASYASAFTNTSSIYGNSPQGRTHLPGAANWGNTTANGNSTIYAGASDFERTTMLQSSLWNGGFAEYVQTPPGGQGG